MRIATVVSLLVALLASAACDGGTGASPGGGEYIAVLASPHGPDGAALLEIGTEGVVEVTASSSALFQEPVSGGKRLVLVRQAPGRIEFRVQVARGYEPPAVRVLQVVDGDNRQRPSVAEYRVTYTPTRGEP